MVAVLTAHSGLRPEAKRYIMAGRGVAVDKAGRGDFSTIQDAVDFLAARESGGLGGGRIWIRNGTYEEAVVVPSGHNNFLLEGESWDTIIDGGTIGHALSIVRADCTVQNIQLKTTAGAGNAYDCLRDTAHDAFASTFTNIYCSESDSSGIFSYGAHTKIIGCYMLSCDGEAVRNASVRCLNLGVTMQSCFNGVYWWDSSADHNSTIACHIVSNSNYGVQIGASTENCILVANKIHSNTTGNVIDSSGTAVNASNDEDSGS